MDVKSVYTEKLIVPSGKALLIFLVCILTIGAIAFEYAYSFSLEQFGLLLFPLIAGAILSGLSGMAVIPLLNRWKTGQVIQEDGPQTHLKKAGTPTMGGIFFVPVAVILSIVWSIFFKIGVSAELMAVCLLTISYGFIGWVDDWQVLRRKSNKGISPRMKLTLQIAFGTLFCCWLFWYKSSVAEISLLGFNLSLGWLFLPLAVFVLTAESNATNLTDGVDGLAAGTGAIALGGLGVILGWDYSALAVFCACLSGGCLGFLIHNRNPAVVFMGDTGSLALGGALAAVGLSSNNLWALFLIGGVFFIESVSVIAQVGYYKATKGPDGEGKRLLKMAPIHHHFELSGWSETQVVGLFYLASIFFVALAYWLR